MAKKNDVDSAVAAGNTQGRKVVGPGGPGYSVAPVKSGTDVPRKNTQSGTDPSAGTATNRSDVMQERLGASYRVVVGGNYAPVTAPEAKLTQANGRVLPASVSRSRSKSFSDGPTIAY